MSLPDILIGSSQPIVFDREAVAARLSGPRVQDLRQDTQSRGPVTFGGAPGL